MYVWKPFTLMAGFVVQGHILYYIMLYMLTKKYTHTIYISYELYYN